ncbi:membrane protein insertase YidC [Agrococcus jejuensis]|uniref:Membrane protein insertase YidC n=1 Tax=Agrococcus jejuensis TaxID=399736 RepID=A0A1G8DCY2_9MICO|nr:membrane protein insertase YidC [Agrococcus jejuensis]SDH55567.1 YidC/Oxa1 family membrane protein insertase [Agrococcus jejuensis]
MPDILGLLMWPIKWVLEAILAGAHFGLEALGMDPFSGLVWVLSIASLTLVVRTAMIPLTVRQILSSRKALEVAPEIKKIQDKYRGKKDQFSREAMQRETMEAYRKAGTNPFASCLPLLVQMPIFFGLVTVLQTANRGEAGVGFMGVSLAEQFQQASLFDAVPLNMTMQHGFEQGNVAVIATSIVMTLIMVATQFYTQLQIMSKNQTPAMKESPMYKQQRIILYVIPVFLLISAWAFPIATMFYWLVSNIYTLIQQLIIISKLPNPGSDAALAREARMARKRQRQGLPAEGSESTTTTEVEETPVIVNTQRQQPKRKGTKAQRDGGPK